MLAQSHLGDSAVVSLQVLDLSRNNLLVFSLFLPLLKELNLSGNKLLALPSGAHLPNLQTLEVQVRTNQSAGSAVAPVTPV